MARISIIDSLCLCISRDDVPLIFRICLKRFCWIWWIFLMIESCTLLLILHRIRLIWERLAVSWLHVWLWTHSPSTCPTLGILRFETISSCRIFIYYYLLLIHSKLLVNLLLHELEDGVWTQTPFFSSWYTIFRAYLINTRKSIVSRTRKRCLTPDTVF